MKSYNNSWSANEFYCLHQGSHEWRLTVRKLRHQTTTIINTMMIFFRTCTPTEIRLIYYAFLSACGEFYWLETTISTISGATFQLLRLRMVALMKQRIQHFILDRTDAGFDFGWMILWVYWKHACFQKIVYKIVPSYFRRNSLQQQLLLIVFYLVFVQHIRRVCLYLR